MVLWLRVPKSDAPFLFMAQGIKWTAKYLTYCFSLTELDTKECLVVVSYDQQEKREGAGTPKAVVTVVKGWLERKAKCLTTLVEEKSALHLSSGHDLDITTQREMLYLTVQLFLHSPKHTCCIKVTTH